MKKIIFFDLDGTIHSKTKNKIMPNTIKLIKELYKLKDVELGIATGRPPSNISMLKDLLKYFKYKIFINGALAYKDDKLVYENPINPKDLKSVFENVVKNNVMTGFIGKNKEYVLNINSNFKEIDYQNIKNLETFTKNHLNNKIYQVWLFTKDLNEIKETLKNTNFKKYSWHQGGYDIVNNNTNKALAIKTLLKNETNYKLISVGDGDNDIEMIEISDIGIAMENSGFKKLKEKATYVAPHIDSDELYNFFKEIKLIS